MSFVRLAGKTLAVLVALVVALYLVINLAALAKGAAERRSLAEDVTSKLARLVPTVEQEQAEMVAGVGMEPEYAWVEQSCRFSTDDSGWMVNNYRETCVLRSVQVWPVSTEAEALVRVGLPSAQNPAIDGCTSLGLVGGEGGPAATYVDDAADPWCLPGPSPYGDQTRAVIGDATAVPPGTWLMVRRETPLVDEPIGCARWSIIFCSNPWTGHAFGDAP